MKVKERDLLTGMKAYLSRCEWRLKNYFLVHLHYRGDL